MVFYLKALLVFGSMVFTIISSLSVNASVPHPKENPRAVVQVSAASEVLVGLAPEATANLQKRFTLEGFFAGETIARGSIFSKIAGAGRSFRALVKGTWDGKVLTLVETYQYAATPSEQRVWRFTKTGKNTYVAESDEVLAKATVTLDGRVARFKYQKLIPRPGKKKPVKVTFHEAWTLQKNGVLESRTELKKFVRVGREAINFVRLGNESALKAP